MFKIDHISFRKPHVPADFSIIFYPNLYDEKVQEDLKRKLAFTFALDVRRACMLHTTRPFHLVSLNAYSPQESAGGIGIVDEFGTLVFRVERRSNDKGKVVYRLYTPHNELKARGRDKNSIESENAAYLLNVLKKPFSPNAKDTNLGMTINNAINHTENHMRRCFEYFFENSRANSDFTVASGNLMDTHFALAELFGDGPMLEETRRKVRSAYEVNKERYLQWCDERKETIDAFSKGVWFIGYNRVANIYTVASSKPVSPHSNSIELDNGPFLVRKLSDLHADIYEPMMFSLTMCKTSKEDIFTLGDEKLIPDRDHVFGSCFASTWCQVISSQSGWNNNQWLMLAK